MNAELAECMWFPDGSVDRRALMREVTRSYLPLGQEEAIMVEAYRTDRKGFIGVPRQFGIAYAKRNGVKWIDKTSPGRKVTVPGKVSMRDYQVPFIEELLDRAEDEYDMVAKAATGKGKTTLSLRLIQILQSNAIIVVDQDNLKQQWIERARDQFGIPEDRIGIVQGKEFDFVGKTIVIAMVQTLVQKTFPPEFYAYFGIAVFDECHVFGAPTFSRAMMMFSARLRIGVSATPERGDSLRCLIDWNLGGVGPQLGHKHRKSKVYYIENDSVYSWYANTSPKTGRYLQEISEDAHRNWLLCRAIQWLYGTGRDILVISERIEQLEGIRALCALSGIPAAAMGVYAGYQIRWMFEKDPKPAGRPAGWEKGTDYTPVHFTAVRKRIPKKTLEQTKETAQILFATYGMFAKGVDVPRLAAGIDCTPRSKAQQVHGRILRDNDGKMTPIWVTVRDRNSHRADFQFLQRLADYVADNAEVYLWDMDKGVRPSDAGALKQDVLQNVSFLKTCRYITTIDGHGTIQTPSTRTR